MCRRRTWTVVAAVAVLIEPATDRAWSDDGVAPAPPTVVAVPDASPCCPRRSQPRLHRSRTAWRSPWRVDLQASASLLEAPTGMVGTPPTGVAALRWSTLDYDPAFGGRVTLARRFRQGGELDVRGAFYGGWSDQQRTTGAFGYTNGAGQSPPATVTLESEADLFSGEANYWRRLQECPVCLRWGLGFRAIVLNETARARDWVGLAADSLLVGEADNRFLGGQVMLSGAFTLWRGATLTVGGRGLLGAMTREVSITDRSILSGGSKHARDESTEFGWGAELTLDLDIALNETVSLTAGYALLFLDEVTRAHGAMDFTRASTGAVQAQVTSDDLLVHSAFLGFGFRF